MLEGADQIVQNTMVGVRYHHTPRRRPRLHIDSQIAVQSAVTKEYYESTRDVRRSFEIVKHVIEKCVCMLDRLKNNPDADYFADVSRLDS